MAKVGAAGSGSECSVACWTFSADGGEPGGLGLGGSVQRGRAEAGQLVESIGASLVPLMTQAQLHRSGTVQVRVDDVVAVGTRLMRSLRAAGVDTLASSERKSRSIRIGMTR